MNRYDSLIFCTIRSRSLHLLGIEEVVQYAFLYSLTKSNLLDFVATSTAMKNQK